MPIPAAINIAFLGPVEISKSRLKKYIGRLGTLVSTADFREIPTLPRPTEGDWYSAEDLYNATPRRNGIDYQVIIVSRPLAANFFAYYYDKKFNYIVMTTFDTDALANSIGVKLEKALCYILALGVTGRTFVERDGDIVKLMAEPPEGRPFDLCMNKLDARFGIQSLEISSRVETALQERGFSNEEIRCVRLAFRGLRDTPCDRALHFIEKHWVAMTISFIVGIATSSIVALAL